jgi:hypothetical protein
MTGWCGDDELVQTALAMGEALLVLYFFDFDPD